MTIPLATRLRPKLLNEFVGQSHLLAPGKPLSQAIERSRLHSMILWGPPGVGKTTLADLIAENADAQVQRISAVLAGVKDIREIVKQAQQTKLLGQDTVLFVDEVHRFNKSQQDAFLPHVESGDIILIGATTENPSFQLNNALLSRARVYVLKSLSESDLLAVIERALSSSQGLANSRLRMAMPLRKKLIAFCDGDARQCLNLLEMAADFSAENSEINDETVNEVLSTSVRRFDQQGDVFYDQISALHKCVRGSDPDAALYWFVRMIDGGCDPFYIARRIVRMASEDIGNADPRALQLSLDAWQTYERLGSPEGELTLAQAIIYCAAAPKSNAVYLAYNQASALVKQRPSLEVPVHLRNAPTALMKEIGCGQGYRYAHDEPNGFAAGVNYFPDGMAPEKFYQPVERGLEIKIKEKLQRLRKLSMESR